MKKSRGFWDPIPHKLFLQGYDYGNPKFSPDGKMLAYILKGEKEAAIFIRDMDTGISRQITAGYKLSTGTAYGGGLYCWTSNSKEIIFTSKGRLHKVSAQGGEVIPLQSIDLSFNPTEHDGTILFSVEHENSMSIGIMKKEEWPQKLPFEADFLYDATVNPVSGEIAVHHWNFPNMSWNNSRISVLKDDKLIHVTEEEGVSVCQPRFSPDGKYLAFISDKNGWWNIWIANADGTEAHQLVPAEEDHCYSTWVTGSSNYQWLGNSDEIIFTRIREGSFGLSKVKISTGEIVDLDSETGDYSNLSINYIQNELAFDFTNYKTKSSIRVLNIKSGEIRTVYESGLALGSENLRKIVKPVHITYPTSDGEQAHGNFYALEDENGKIENCPTIFKIHGGPTGMSRDRFNADICYWVSRGWAVFEVNHRGSIGYGREFREKLNGNWGIYDVEDTISALNYLSKIGKVDSSKSIVMGGSAGGYTTLMCLAKHPGVFAAGVNLFGVSDLFGLSEETHYLESQYDTILVGPLPEAAKKFFERSPVYIADKITDPLLILQGSDDPVVPKNQSDRIAELVKGPVEYKVYEGEGHGFRMYHTISDMMKRTQKFLLHHVLYK